MSYKTFVPTRRAMRAAARLYVFEQQNGLWTIIEVHALGTPRWLVFQNQRRSTAESCVKRAHEQGQHIVVWGDLSVPMVALASEDVPLLQLEVGT